MLMGALVCFCIPFLDTEHCFMKHWTSCRYGKANTAECWDESMQKDVKESHFQLTGYGKGSPGLTLFSHVLMNPIVLPSDLPWNTLFPKSCWVEVASSHSHVTAMRFSDRCRWIENHHHFVWTHSRVAWLFPSSMGNASPDLSQHLQHSSHTLGKGTCLVQRTSTWKRFGETISGVSFSTSPANPCPPQKGWTYSAKLDVKEAAWCRANPVQKAPCSARCLLRVIWKGVLLYIRQRRSGKVSK